MAYFDQMCYVQRFMQQSNLFSANLQKIKLLQMTHFVRIFEKYRGFRDFQHFWFDRFSRNSVLKLAEALFFCVP